MRENSTQVIEKSFDKVYQRNVHDIVALILSSQHSRWISFVLLDKFITSWLANILALWVSVRQERHRAWEQVVQKNISEEICQNQ